MNTNYIDTKTQLTYSYNMNTGALRNANGKVVGKGVEAIEQRELTRIDAKAN